MSIEKKLFELKAQRAEMLKNAEGAIGENKKDDYAACMTKVAELNGEIENMQSLLNEQMRFGKDNPMPNENEANTDRAMAFLRGDSIKFTSTDVSNMLNRTFDPKNVIIPTDTIIAPPRAGTSLRDSLGAVSSIVDQVTVEDLTGTGGIEELYIKEGLTASGNDVESPPTSVVTSDPVVRRASIKPYELKVTTYIDRNLRNLSPNNFLARVQSLAARALRQKTGELIYLGSGGASPTMFGLLNAKNTDGENIYDTHEITGSITSDTLMNLYFAYGADEEVGGMARLYLTKEDLAAIGALKGTNEKKRLFDITPDSANANTGIISDGGFIIPYTLSKSLNSITGAIAGANPIQTMIYGNPLAYELGLFSGFEIRMDESEKASLRQISVLGDVMVGGNLIVDKSMVVATIPGT